MKRLLREPLVHFLLAGAALFVLFGVLDEGVDEPGPREIVVSAGLVEHLATTFSRTRQRPPTPEELKELVDAHVEEEILSREAVALGLDRDDVIIRRRLKQKMDFLFEDLEALAEPTDEELAAYFDEHAEDYREEPRFTLVHVFLAQDRGERLEPDAAALLEQLRSGVVVYDGTLGDRTLLPPAFRDERRTALAARFGEAFAAGVDAIDEIGTWSGPVRSAFGLHLVRIDARRDGRVPTLDEIRPAVRRDLLALRRERSRRATLDALLARYDVRIEWPQADGAAPQGAEAPQDAVAPAGDAS